MHALAGQRVQVNAQCRYQGLAFTGTHFGDLAFVQRHAADQLDIEVAHAQYPPGGLTDRGECFGQQIIQRSTVREALAELGGLGL